MNIYNYDEDTKEYLFTSEAEADPAETEKQGKFIPLIPANATLIAIPSYNSDNQIPVFENNNWVVKSDYRKNYYKVDDNFNVEEITTIGEQTGFCIVDKEVGEDIKINPDWYKIVEDNVVKKTSEEYEQEQIAKRQETFNKEFFLTSLGYIRRNVNMATGQTKDFLADLLPTISMAVTAGQEVPIITYSEPDFTKEFTLEYMESLQTVKNVTPQFTQECALQLSKDFLPTNLSVE